MTPYNEKRVAKGVGSLQQELRLQAKEICAFLPRHRASLTKKSMSRPGWQPMVVGNADDSPQPVLLFLGDVGFRIAPAGSPLSRIAVALDQSFGVRDWCDLY